MKAAEFFKKLFKKENRFSLFVGYPLWALLVTISIEFIKGFISSSLGAGLRTIPYVGIVLEWYMTLIILGILFIFFNEIIQEYIKRLFDYLIRSLRR